MADPCPTCGIGRIKPVQMTLVRVYDATLVHVPNVPAWQCDVCGTSYYDSPTLRGIEVLIGEAGPPPNHYTPAMLTPPADDIVPSDDLPESIHPRPEG